MKITVTLAHYCSLTEVYSLLQSPRPADEMISSKCLFEYNLKARIPTIITQVYNASISGVNMSRKRINYVIIGNK